MVSVLVTMAKVRAVLVEEGGIPVLAEIVEVRTPRQKEIRVVILFGYRENERKCKKICSGEVNLISRGQISLSLLNLQHQV